LRLAKLIVAEPRGHRTLGTEKGSNGLRIGCGRIGPMFRCCADRLPAQAWWPVPTGQMNPCQEVLQRMRPAVRHLEHPVKELRRESAGELPQVEEQLPGGVRLGECTMRMRVGQAKLSRAVR